MEVKIEQLVCASLSGVNSTGLDEKTLDYGDEDDTTEKDAWGNAW